MQAPIGALCATSVHRPCCLPSGLPGGAEKEMTGILIDDLLLLKGEALSDRTGVRGKLFVVRSGAFKSEAPLGAGTRRVLGLHAAGDFMSAEPTLGGVRDAEWSAVRNSTVCVVELACAAAVPRELVPGQPAGAGRVPWRDGAA